MKKIQKKYLSKFLIGLAGLAVVGLGFLILAHAAKAVSFEDVGASLGMGTADLKDVIINVIKWALGLLGLAAVIMMIYGGFVWLTSRGNQNQIDKAKKILINAAIGLVIVLLSWAIVLLIQRFITQATSSASAAECTVSDPTTWPICTLCDDNGDGIIGNDIGTLIPDPSCVTPTSQQYRAQWLDPSHATTDVSLCSAVQGKWGGLPFPTSNDIDSTSTMPVSEESTGTLTSGTLAFSGEYASFDHPTQDFKPNTVYTVDATGIKSVAPASIASSFPLLGSWTFTTGTTSDNTPPRVADDGAGNYLTVPAHNETIECLSPVIEVQFNEEMHVFSALNPDNITISPADATIAKVDMPTPSSIAVKLSGALKKTTTYTITLSADTDNTLTSGKYKGYKDTCLNALDCGNGMGVCTADGDSDDDPADNHRWQFTTADTETIDCTPIITNVSQPSHYGNPGTPLITTITGSNFGLNPTVKFSGNVIADNNGGNTSSCFNNNNFSNQATSPACIQSNNNTQIQTIVPAGPLGYAPNGAVDGPVSVQVGLVSSPASTVAVDIQSPHVDWVYPREGKAGRFVTISGSGFGAGGTVRFRRVGGPQFPASIPSCAASGWTDTQIVVQVPVGFNFGDTTYIQVDRGIGQTGISNLAQFDIKDVDGPNLCSINPTSSNDGTAALAANGEGFGADPAAVSIVYGTFGGVLNSLIDDKNLTASPNGALGNGTYNFAVGVNGRYSNPLQYRIPKDPVPEVVQDSACNQGASITPSPNPFPNSVNVCRNIIISAKFNTAMNTGAVNGLTDPNRITFRRCDSDTASFGCASPLAVAGTLTAPLSNLVKFEPTSNLENGYWYEGRIQAGILSAAGVALPSDYIWHFKVRTEDTDCAVDWVSINPNHAGPLHTGETQAFLAQGNSSQCYELTGTSGFAWTTSDTTLSGPINLSTAIRVNDTDTAQVPAGSNNGTAVLTADLEGKSGSAELVVERYYCEVNTDCNTQTNSFGVVCAGSVCNQSAKRCAPWVNEIEFPTGPAGNIVNVKGCFFGPVKGDGKVTFTNGAQVEEGSFAACGPALWTDDSIKVEARPEGAVLGSAWNVQVQTGSSYGSLQSPAPGPTYTITNQCASNTGGAVNVPASGVPILCSLNPSLAKEGANITFNGARFVAGGQTFYTQYQDAVLNRFNLTGGGNFTSTQVTNSTVPNNTGAPLATPTQATVGTPSGGEYCIATPAAFAVKCDKNSECGSGCCSVNICQPNLLLCTEGLINSITPAVGPLACRNTVFTISFGKLMQHASLNSSTIKIRRGNSTVSPTSMVIRDVALPLPHTEVDIWPNDPFLAPANNYNIFIKGGSAGVLSMENKFLTADFIQGNYSVVAATPICQVDHVSIFRNGAAITSDTFFCSDSGCTANGNIDNDLATAGNQHGFAARAYDKNNIQLSVSDQAWVQADTSGVGSSSNTYQGGVNSAACDGDAENPGDTYCGTSLNVPSGSETLSVTLTGAGSTGEATASIPVNSFLCSKPWPVPPATWPFRDPASAADPTHSFTTAFCRDGNDKYTLALPAVQGLAIDPGLLKEYFLFVQDAVTLENTGDAIGVRIYENLGELSPERWYKKQLGKDFSGNKLEVDGYTAIREGRTIYVGAYNRYSSIKPTNVILSNIYVFSYSDKAKSETIKIFEELIKNLKFNQNTGLFAINPAGQASLRLDMKRVNNYLEIIYALETYKKAKGFYPRLEAGSFLKNISTSNWPSWQDELGKALNLQMPKDEKGWDSVQVNALCPVPGFDPQTCWNQTDKKFIYPNNGANPPLSQGILYKYDENSTPEDLSDDKASLFGTVEYISLPRDAGISVYVQPPTAGILTQDACPNAVYPDSECAGFNVLFSSNNFSAIDEDKNYNLASDTTAPTASFVSPAAGNVEGEIDVVVMAVDDISGIAKVDYTLRQGANILKQATITTADAASNYHWAWNTRERTNGAYTIEVTATDRAKNISIAITRNYTINNPLPDTLPPLITLNAPVNVNNVTISEGMTLSATADDQPATPSSTETGIAKIEFYIGTTKIDQDPDPACASSCPTGLYTGNYTLTEADLAGFSASTYTYSVVAYDAYGNNFIRQLQVQISHTSLLPVITSSLEVTATIGDFFSYAITAATPPGHDINLTNGFNAAGLPAGLSVDTTTGIISGTPTTEGIFNVALFATNDAGTGQAIMALTVESAPCATPVIDPSTLSASAAVGVAFSYTITATESPTSFSASLPSGLTTLSVNSSTGEISGTPISGMEGTYDIPITATNACGATGSATLVLDINGLCPAPTFLWPTAAAENFLAVDPFHLHVLASGAVSYIDPPSGMPAWMSFSLHIAPITYSLDGGQTAATRPIPAGGPYPVAITATSACGSTATRTKNISIIPCVKPTFTTKPAVVSAILGTIYTASSPLYSQSLTGSTPFSYTTFSGTVPPGLIAEVSGSAFRIRGTPTVAGTYNFTARVKHNPDPDNLCGYDDLPVTVTVGSGCTNADIPAQTTTVGTVSSAYSYTIVRTGTAPITWAITSGSVPGLNLNTTTGVYSGTPTTAGTYNVTFTAHGNAPCNTVATSQLTFTINAACVNASIPVQTPPTGTAASAYSYTIVRTGTAPITWAITSGSVPGLNLNTTTGVYSGTPTTAGTYNVTFTAHGNAPCNTVATSQLTFTINPAAACTNPDITTPAAPGALPDGMVNNAYSYTPAGNGTAPLTWSISAGSLPPGLNINSSTGVIFGTPTMAAAGITYNFSIHLVNTCSAVTDTVAVSLKIKCNCPSGCCTAAATCVSPPTTSQCGWNGANCVTCPLGQTCNATGVCVAPTCNASTCPGGCCDGTGNCVVYASQDNTQCGAAGASCVSCTSATSCNATSHACTNPCPAGSNGIDCKTTTAAYENGVCKNNICRRYDYRIDLAWTCSGTSGDCYGSRNNDLYVFPENSTGSAVSYLNPGPQSGAEFIADSIGGISGVNKETVIINSPSNIRYDAYARVRTSGQLLTTNDAKNMSITMRSQSGATVPNPSSISNTNNYVRFTQNWWQGFSSLFNSGSPVLTAGNRSMYDNVDVPGICYRFLGSTPPAWTGDYLNCDPALPPINGRCGLFYGDYRPIETRMQGVDGLDNGDPGCQTIYNKCSLAATKGVCGCIADNGGPFNDDHVIIGDAADGTVPHRFTAVYPDNEYRSGQIIRIEWTIQLGQSDIDWKRYETFSMSAADGWDKTYQFDSTLTKNWMRVKVNFDSITDKLTSFDVSLVDASAIGGGAWISGDVILNTSFICGVQTASCSSTYLDLMSMPFKGPVYYGCNNGVNLSTQCSGVNLCRLETTNQCVLGTHCCRP